MRCMAILEEDFVNYKKPSMLIGFPTCTMKCNKDAKKRVCQNEEFNDKGELYISPERIVKHYLGNSLTEAFVFGGLEPFDSFDDLLILVDEIRKHVKDEVVIYTGYEKDEIIDKLQALKNYENIIVKFGRFIPDSEPKFDELLGVTLQSENQYSERL